MAEMPKAVDVGPFPFEIVVSETPIQPDAVPAWERDDLMGQCDRLNLKIWVRESLPPAQKRETLLHETTHAVHFVAGWNAQERVKVETFVSRTTPLLLDTLRRNPALVAFLLERER